MTDMRLFLRDVLSGSPSSRARHLRQARVIQHAINQHWGIANPHRWRVKHLRWFLQHHCAGLAPISRYRYWLTVALMARRRHRTEDWQAHLRGSWQRPDGSHTMHACRSHQRLEKAPGCAARP